MRLLDTHMLVYSVEFLYFFLFKYTEDNKTNKQKNPHKLVSVLFFSTAPHLSQSTLPELLYVFDDYF